MYLFLICSQILSKQYNIIYSNIGHIVLSSKEYFTLPVTSKVSLKIDFRLFVIFRALLFIIYIFFLVNWTKFYKTNVNLPKISHNAFRFYWRDFYATSEKWKLFIFLVFTLLKWFIFLLKYYFWLIYPWRRTCTYPST